MIQDSLSATFAALADPTRRAILARLAQGETSVTELAQPFAMSLPAVSRHLKVLERAHLIERGREAQVLQFGARLRKAQLGLVAEREQRFMAARAGAGASDREHFVR